MEHMRKLCVSQAAAWQAAPSAGSPDVRARYRGVRRLEGGLVALTHALALSLGPQVQGKLPQPGMDRRLRVATMKSRICFCLGVMKGNLKTIPTTRRFSITLDVILWRL